MKEDGGKEISKAASIRAYRKQHGLTQELKYVREKDLARVLSLLKREGLITFAGSSHTNP